MSSKNNEITKENLDQFLNDLAKTYKKMAGRKEPAEIILVGGAAILTNYGFRDMTTDIDAIINAASAMKDAINIVGDKYNLPNGWLNADFTQTASYSHKIPEHSVYYKTFANILSVRTVKDEYLVAMKLKSGRIYKHDQSDIVGIITSSKGSINPLTPESISSAFFELYGEELPEKDTKLVRQIIETLDAEQFYADTVAKEKLAKQTLIDFQEQYPGVINQENAEQLANRLMSLKN